MSKIKIKIKQNDSDMPESYAQGEYKVDLTRAYAEVSPVFARHLVAVGYAEYMAADLKRAAQKQAEANEDLPNFVAREEDTNIAVPAPSVGDVDAVPTEELTSDDPFEPISQLPAEPEMLTEQGTPKPEQGTPKPATAKSKRKR